MSSFWLLNLVVQILLHEISIFLQTLCIGARPLNRNINMFLYFGHMFNAHFSAFSIRSLDIYKSLVDASQDLTKQTKCIVQHLSDSTNKYMGVIYLFYRQQRDLQSNWNDILISLSHILHEFSKISIPILWNTKEEFYYVTLFNFEISILKFSFIIWSI